MEIRIVAFVTNEFVELIIFLVSEITNFILKPLENQLLYPIPLCGSQLILALPSSPAGWARFFAPLGVGVNEENQLFYVFHSRHSVLFFDREITFKPSSMQSKSKHYYYLYIVGNKFIIL